MYAAVNDVTPQILHNTWVVVKYRLDICRAPNESLVVVPVFTLCSNWLHLLILISSEVIAINFIVLTSGIRCILKRKNSYSHTASRHGLEYEI